MTIPSNHGDRIFPRRSLQGRAHQCLALRPWAAESPQEDDDFNALHSELQNPFTAWMAVATRLYK